MGGTRNLNNFQVLRVNIPPVAKEAAAAPMGNVPSVLLNAAANAKMHNNAQVKKTTPAKEKNEINGKMRGAAVSKTPGESAASAADSSGVSAEARKLSISYAMRKKIMAVREKNSCMVGAPLTQLIRESPPRSPSLIECDNEDAQSVPDVDAIEEDIDDGRDMDLRAPRENGSSARPSATAEALDPYGNPDVVNISDDDDDNNDVVASNGPCAHGVLEDMRPEVLDDDVGVMCKSQDMYATSHGGEEEEEEEEEQEQDVDGQAAPGAGLDDYPEVLDGDEALLLDAYGEELGEEEAVIIAEEASGEEAQQEVGENDPFNGGGVTSAFQDLYPEVVEIFDDEVEIADKGKEKVIKRGRSTANEARASGATSSILEAGNGISEQLGSMVKEDASAAKETPDPLREVLEYKLADKEDLLKEVLNYRIEPREKTKEDTSLKEVLEYNLADGKTDAPANGNNDAYYRELLGVRSDSPTPKQAQKKSHSPKRTRQASEDARKSAKANQPKSPGGVGKDGGVLDLFALWAADIEAKKDKDPHEKDATVQPTAAGSQLKTRGLGYCKPNPTTWGGPKTGLDNRSAASSSTRNPNGARASRICPSSLAQDPRREHINQQSAKRLKPNEQSRTGSIGINTTSTHIKAEVVDCDGGDAKSPSEVFHLQLLGL